MVITDKPDSKTFKTKLLLKLNWINVDMLLSLLSLNNEQLKL